MTRPPTIADLRHRVTVERYAVAGRTPMGADVTAWVPVCTVWAAVEPLAGRELVDARQVRADVTHRVVIRAREDVRARGARCRIVHRGRAMEVTAALDAGERRRFVALLCVEEPGGASDAEG